MEWMIAKCTLPNEIVDFMNSVFEIYEIRGNVGNCKGIKFEVRTNEMNHSRPHVHAKYGEYEVSIDIYNAEILAGNLPNKKQKIAIDWVSANKEKLLNEWRLIAVSAISSLTSSRLDL